MTRIQLLELLIQQARANGFIFKRWFERHAGTPWETPGSAVEWLATGERALLLIFSHGFARHFWESGKRATFVVPSQTFQRVMRNGEVRTVMRRAHVRRSSHTDVWRYHLREMAAAPEPLRYIRRYLLIEDALEDRDIPNGESAA